MRLKVVSLPSKVRLLMSFRSFEEIQGRLEAATEQCSGPLALLPDIQVGSSSHAPFTRHPSRLPDFISCMTSSDILDDHIICGEGTFEGDSVDPCRR